MTKSEWSITPKNYKPRQKFEKGEIGKGRQERPYLVRYYNGGSKCTKHANYHEVFDILLLVW
jgi:hypothetical protein